jgi:hypothetical protein
MASFLPTGLQTQMPMTLQQPMAGQANFSHQQNFNPMFQPAQAQSLPMQQIEPMQMMMQMMQMMMQVLFSVMGGGMGGQNPSPGLQPPANQVPTPQPPVAPAPPPVAPQPPAAQQPQMDWLNPFTTFMEQFISVLRNVAQPPAAAPEAETTPDPAPAPAPTDPCGCPPKHFNPVPHPYPPIGGTPPGGIPGQPQQPAPTPPAPPPASPLPPPGHENRVWGDPHFEGLFHGVKETEETGDLDGNGKIGDVVSQKYDYQGKAGQTINVLSDSGVQINGELGAWGKNGATVFTEMGLQIRGEDGQVYKLEYGLGEKEPTLTIPGQEPVKLTKDETIQLGGPGQSVTWNGNNDLAIQATEYNFTIKRQNGYLNLHTSTTDNYDGRNNDGVLGISGNIEAIGGKVQNGRQGSGANGEGVATTDGKGNGAERAPEEYLVNDGLLGQDTRFNSFNTQTVR